MERAFDDTNEPIIVIIAPLAAEWCELLESNTEPQTVEHAAAGTSFSPSRSVDDVNTCHCHE